ncbi:hypothetical protein EV128_103256 [Rhizobium azibense]|nr:hypothetical protein EV128_103256 [Rhizobium azibense]
MNANVKIDLESASALWKDGSSIGVIAPKYGCLPADSRDIPAAANPRQRRRASWYRQGAA